MLSKCVLEKILVSTLDWREINQLILEEINPEGTDFEAEAPILWPLDGTSWLIWKDPEAGKDWRREEKGAEEDQIVR